MSGDKSSTCPSCGCAKLSFERKHIQHNDIEIQWVKGWHCPCGNVVLDAEEAVRVQNEYQDSRAFWDAVDRIPTGE